MKKILIIGIVLGVFTFVMIPSGAGPEDVILDHPIELEVPGTFETVDHNADQKAESIVFSVKIKAFQEGNFMVTGNLEGKKNGAWVSLATTVVPIDWTPDNNLVKLSFSGGNIYQQKISGPFRVNITLKSGDWELPEQVAGFSPAYNWKSFTAETNASGQIKTISQAERAAQTWAEYNSLKLGDLIGINYNYDNWQIEYKAKKGQAILRFLVSPEGKVTFLKIDKRS